MALVSIHEVSFSFDNHVLLDHVSLHLQRQERVCLLGRNGTGKTTFMKLVNKEIEPDSGDIRYAPGVRVARIAQEVPVGWESSTVYSVIARGLGLLGESLARLHELTSSDTAERESLQQAILLFFCYISYIIG